MASISDTRQAYVITYNTCVARSFLRPDVLVLAGGGILGEAWMTGVLAGLEDTTKVDFRTVESFVGTSAGSIVGANLAAGRSPRRPGADLVREAEEAGGEPPPDPPRGPAHAAAREAARWGWALSAPLAGAATALGAPGGALARSALLARAPSAGRRLDGLRGHVARSGVRFDGRLRVCCVDKATGRRVVFGAPGAPPAEVADAVAGSCAIPWVFAPALIGGREYVDGGVWSVTNLDAAPAGRDSDVLCLDPSAGLGSGAGGPMGLLRQAFRVAVAVEIQVLRNRGAHVRHVGPDGAAAALMGANLMDPGPAQRVLAAGFRQGRALAAAGG
jgi:NTE family protein